MHERIYSMVGRISCKSLSGLCLPIARALAFFLAAVTLGCSHPRLPPLCPQVDQGRQGLSRANTLRRHCPLHIALWRRRGSFRHANKQILRYSWAPWIWRCNKAIYHGQRENSTNSSLTAAGPTMSNSLQPTTSPTMAAKLIICCRFTLTITTQPTYYLSRSARLGFLQDS
ncbi:hypothetical protein DFH06DRAFT_600781 [Mycena polygramma]|nr:hypothetical protein DFH06DRAFT_600781 [Mycena polygramma]